MIEQLSIWDDIIPIYKIEKPVRLIELFAGIGSQHQALKNLGLAIDHSMICEWQVNSIQAYNDIHVRDYADYSIGKSKDELVAFLVGKGVSSDYQSPMSEAQLMRKGENWLRQTYNNVVATHNLVNIMTVRGEDLNITETDKYEYIMTYSFPCFPADTLVLTKGGNKRIDQIKRGDMVLTHTNQWQKVSNFFEQGRKPIYLIKGMAFHELRTTRNHKLLARTMYRKWNNDKRVDERYFGDPIWKETKDLTKQDYLGVSIIQDEVMPKWNNHIINDIISQEDFWYVMGRYVADGWKRTQGGIVIASNLIKVVPLTDALDRLNINYCVAKEKSIKKVHIPRIAFSAFVDQFGYYASNKHLSQMVMLLPKNLLKAFIEGYLYGDGSIVGKVVKASSISQALIYDVAQCVAKVYQTPYKIYKNKRPAKTIIENRIVNQKDDYQLVFKKDKNKQDKAFYENGYIWFPIQSVELIGEALVYDIQVDNDHSFMANGTIAHNCQDLSLAGKRAGMTRDSGTRSGLLWEVERLLKETKELPQILLMENVPDVIGTNNIRLFQEWELFLSQLGYSNHCEILNAKDYGIPQNRNRAFMVSILGNYLYRFPQKQELKLRLKDMLELEVDEKYYLSAEVYNQINEQYGVIGGELRCDEGFRTFNDNLMGTLRTIDACGDKVVLEQIAIPEATKQGYALATDGDGIYINRPHQKRGVVQKGMIQTIKAESNDIGVVMGNLRIRKLTPKECWRLMGFKDEQFNLAQVNQSNSTLYHQAGDSIVVNVLEAIFKQLMRGSD